MASTFASVSRDRVEGNRKVTITDVTLVDNYVTGGLPVTAAQLGLNTVDYAICQIKTSATTIVAAYFDAVASKIKLQAAGAEVANAAVIGAAVITVIASGQ